MNDSVMVFGKGYLGTRIADYFGWESTNTNPLHRSELDSFLDKKNPGVILNAIGKTGRPNIDWCEVNKEATLESNVIAAANLSLASMKRGMHFVHIGSGCIYWGDNGGRGFSEIDEPNFYGPQFYAKTKIIAEKIIAENPQALILRIRMPIDDRPHPRNLIDKLKKYPRVIDIPNSMTTVPHMLPVMEELIKKRATGAYNLTNPEMISAKEIMQMYQEIVDNNHTFEVLSLSDLDAMTPGKRSNCFLNTRKLEQEGLVLPPIKEAVEECLRAYNKPN